MSARARRFPATALALLLAGALGACVTASQGERMRNDLAKLSKRVEAQEAQLDATEKRYAAANEQMDRLRKVLDEATALLTRNSADVGAKVARSEADIAALTGRLEEARYLLEQLQKKLGEFDVRMTSLEATQDRIAEKVAPTMPEDKDALWKEAQTRLAAGSKDEARRYLRAFADKFPADPRTPEAFVAIGKTYAADGNHTVAVSWYQRVIDKHPKATQVPDAMFLLGQSFAELKFCTEARAFFLDLAKRYPKSPQAGEAKDRARDLSKLAKDRKACVS